MSSDKFTIYMEDHAEELFEKFKDKTIFSLNEKINSKTTILDLFDTFAFEQYQEYEADYSDVIYDQMKDQQMEESMNDD